MNKFGGKMMLFRLFILVGLLIIPSLAEALDCGPLDPREQVNKIVSESISGSAKTLFKIVKVEGDYRSTTVDEVKNLYDKYPNADKLVIKGKVIYFFCTMLNDQKDLSSIEKFNMFTSFISTIDGVIIEPPTTPSALLCSDLDADERKVPGVNKLKTGNFYCEEKSGIIWTVLISKDNSVNHCGEAYSSRGTKGICGAKKFAMTHVKYSKGGGICAGIPSGINNALFCNRLRNNIHDMPINEILVHFDNPDCSIPSTGEHTWGLWFLDQYGNYLEPNAMPGSGHKVLAEETSLGFLYLGNGKIVSELKDKEITNSCKKKVRYLAVN